MFFSLPTIALAASLLSSSGVLAIPHSGHRHLHAVARRDAVLEERAITEVDTVTDWVTVWWDGTSYITPSATSANAIQTQAAADAANLNAAQTPAPITTAAPVAAAAPAAPTPVANNAAVEAASAAAANAAASAASEASAKAAASAASEASAKAAASAASEVAAKAAASAAANVANAAAAAAKNPDGIIGGIVSAVSSVVAPFVPTSVAPVNTPTPVVVTPPSNGGAGKRGLAYNNADLTSSFTGADSKVSWAYNWGSSTPSIPSSFEYVPMLWGTGSDHSNGWQEAATSAIAKGSKHLLAFNEPDLPAQSNLDPGAAAAGYKTFMQPFAGQAKLGSPAVTNGPAPMGIAYLKSFLEACSGCTVDFIPLHWYDSASNVAGFKQHVSDMRDAAGGRKLWITEFGASGSTDEQEAFLKEAIPWLDSQDYVERYAYFYADGVLTQNSVVSALGNVFMSFVS